MSSDGEDYGDLPNDEDLEQALTQVSQSLPRLDDSSSWNRNEDDDEDGGGIASRRPQRDRTNARDKNAEDYPTADEEAAERKKSKYKIHIPKDATHFATQVVYGTQPEGPSSSPPYRARGAIWKMPKQKQPEPPRKETPTIRNFFAPQRSATVHGPGMQVPLAPPRRVLAPIKPAKNNPTILIEDEEDEEDEEGFDRAPNPTMSSAHFDIEKELADLPSDAFSSPVSTISHQPSQRPGATPTSLTQSTLFGGRASQAVVPASQTNKSRNYRADQPPEAPTHHALDLEALKTWVYPTNLGAIRDYQYSIVKNGLFNNLLVALPTGLGKTFIAATIMLNFFRWTKDAKIVFMAPTKPLVSQQIEACFNIVGIPRSTTTMLTGETSPALRAEEWEEKRVFFMTPQTLENDLSSGIADPKKIALLVVDEAHRASGNYAYVKVVTFLRRFSQSFRILALTATPGSSVEAVQGVIDNLEISQVEIRTEDAIDLQQYTHHTQYDQILLDPSEEMVRIQDLYAKSLQPLVDLIAAQTTYFNRDPLSLNTYSVVQAQRGWFASDAGRNASMGVKGMMKSIFSVLASLAHGVKLLNFHGIGCFYETVREFRNGVDEQGSKAGKYRKMVNDSPHFKKMMDLIRVWINKEGFVGHPKLIYLCDTILNHFLDAGEGRGPDNAPPSQTRVIVFAEFRDSAEEIVRTLNKHEPMIRASVFVGQADSKRSQGMNQTKQMDVIQKFKSGVFNVIVATSIGEEGLDIGQVDLIVCYDASTSPIRMLQRVGRTGRKRNGKVFLTLMRGKEEKAWEKAQDNYQKMQKMISSGERFALRSDLSTRIVPRDIIPAVDKRHVEIPEENQIDSSMPEPKRLSKKGKKRPPKKFHMPDGIIAGFQKASKLGKAVNAAKKAQEPEVVDELADEERLLIPALEEVLLSSKEDLELQQQYLNIPEDNAQEVGLPDLSKYPDHQRVLRPVKRVPHSQSTKGLVRTVKAMQAISEAKVEKWKRLYDKHGALEAEQTPSQTIGSDHEDMEASQTASEPPSPPKRAPRPKSKAAPNPKPAPKTKSAKTTRAFTLTQAGVSGSDSEDEEIYSESDLDFVVDDDEDVSGNATQPRSSSPPRRSRPATQPFFELTQFTATQDSDKDDEEMPDLNDLINSRKATATAKTSGKKDRETLEPVSNVRAKRRKIVEDDSDE